MPRSRKPFAKLEPEFVLGESEAGQRFAMMSEKAQLVYLKWWCYCIRSRTKTFRKLEENLKLLSRNLKVSYRIFKSSLSEIVEKCLCLEDSKNNLYLKGINELHNGLIWADGDITGTKRATDGGHFGDKTCAELELELELDNKPPTTTILTTLKGGTTPARKQGELPVVGGGFNSESKEPTTGHDNPATEHYDQVKRTLTQVKLPEGFDAEKFCQEFKPVAKWGIAHQAVAALVAGANVNSEKLLAGLVEACSDKTVRAPMRCAAVRAKLGVNPETLAAVRKFLGAGEAAKPKRYSGRCECGLDWSGTRPEMACRSCGRHLTLLEVEP